MAGLIRREDIDEVRSRARLDDIIGEYVTLKNAGIGSMKGLCPFHDERTPSFHVRPQVGMYHCFGCGESGDAFTFLQKIDGLTFVESVERLAEKVGVQLRYEEGRGPDREEVGRRQRLIDMHAVAAEYFREQLSTPGAEIGRRYLDERGFDSDALATFGVGFAPQSWDSLLRHLRGRRFDTEDIVASGLVSEGRRGVYDRFRGRLVWPIRDVTSRTIGFGARRIFEDDQGPKYLNTPETSLYRKNQVLYGLDLAKRAIAKSKRVVIVEGYTDVMAAHLAGVDQAVATCGTAFGAEHIKIIRRLLGDDSASTGEVIFTFDGDEAGQKAALKAFDDDQRFVAQTFVAVAPSGKDPCELRQTEGDAAVRDLIDTRRPLFEFAITSTIERYDLSTVEGRVGAMRAAAPVLASIKDPAMRPGYVRYVAGLLGMDVDEISGAVEAERRKGPQRQPRGSRGYERSAPGGSGAGRGGMEPGPYGVRNADGSPASRRGEGRYGARDGLGGGSGQARGDAPRQRDGMRAQRGGGTPDPYADVPHDPYAQAPDPEARLDDYADAFGEPPAAPVLDERAVRVERGALQVALQQPRFVNAKLFDSLSGEVFTHPDLRAIHAAMVSAGGIRSALDEPAGWPERVRAACGDDRVAAVVGALSVEPIPAADEAGVERFSRGIIARLFDADMGRIAQELHSRLQRTDPADLEASGRLLHQLQVLEQQRARLRELM